ncbi:MAG: hypothetical protein EOP61_26985, partial [Sphingomonadales bacterium]
MEITCLVPAFKPGYFDYLLSCLKMQSRPAVRVLVSDDTTDNAFTAALQNEFTRTLAGPVPIEIIEGPRQGHHRNIERLLDRFMRRPTSHFHILNDDDLIYPEFYAKHLEIAAKSNPLCSVSKRWLANDGGFPMGYPRLPDEVASDGRMDIGISEKLLSDSIVGNGYNWLGELSQAVFRADFLEAPGSFCEYGDIAYY